MFKIKITTLFIYIIVFQFSIAGEYLQDIPCYVAPPSIDIISTKLEREKYLKYSDEDAENFNQISQNKAHFPYKLSTKNQRGKISKIMDYSINFPRMFDDEKESEEINKLIDIFETTSFFSSAKRSKLEFSEKARLFLLLNRPKSVSQVVNDYLFSTVSKTKKVEYIFVRATLWEPSWEYTNGKDVNFSKVEEYFQKLVQYDSDKKTHLAERFLSETEYQSEWKQAQIPYRELRELLRTDKDKPHVIRKFREKFPGKPIYQCIHDSDITNLRIRTKGTGRFIENIGLYSYYDKMIINNNAPDLLTTGYSASFDNENLSMEKLKANIAISKAIDFDIELRSEMSKKIDPRFAYIPEPNFIVKIDEGKEMLEYSFLGKDYNNGRYKSPLESCNILMNMLEEKPNAKIIFDYKHPIQMKLPDRMMVVKQGRGRNHPLFTLNNISLHKLAQSSFDLRCESKIVYRQFGLIGTSIAGLSTPNCKFTSFFCSLLNDFENLENFEAKFLEKFNLDTEFLNKLKQIKDIIIKKKDEFRHWIEKINALTENQVKICYLLKSSKYSMMKKDILSTLDIEDENNEWSKAINGLRKYGFVDVSGKHWFTTTI